MEIGGNVNERHLGFGTRLLPVVMLLETLRITPGPTGAKLCKIDL